MNEWSPGGNYSRPGTPNQSGRSFRSQWEEPEKGTKPLVVNIRAVSDNNNKTRSFQQHSLEDVTKSSLSIAGKNKQNRNGGSDPRFKRVISNGSQNDACVGTEGRSSRKAGATAAGNAPKAEETKYKIPTWKNVTENRLNNQAGDSAEDGKEAATKKLEEHQPAEGCEKSEMEPDGNLEQDQHQLKGVDKLAFSHDILVKSLSKESFSNCTVNTSLASEDLLDVDVSNQLSMFPTATRVKKVQNWMRDQKPKPEKKQSVITVIGQTQDQDTLSSALRDIDKRRKLVKELDRYAMCGKIIETDSGKEISDLVAKITSLSPPNGRRSKENAFAVVESSGNVPLGRNGSGDTVEKHPEKTDKVSTDVNDAKNDFTSPLTQKRSSSKRKTKKIHLDSGGGYPVKGKIQDFLNRIQYQWLLYVVFLTSGILCWLAFYSFHTNSFASFDFFTKKPKTMTWYEKICMWLWELFRPSSNYKRSSTWNSY